MKSSGCGSSARRTPWRSKTGNSSSSDFQNCASEMDGFSGRPLNSEFICVTPSSAAISMDRFQ